MTRQRRGGIAAILSLLVLAVLWFATRDHTTPAAAATSTTPATAPTVVESTAAVPAPDLHPVTPDEQPSLDRLKKEYESYRAASIYPHWSIPLTADMDFALRWNDAVTEDLALDENTYVRFDGSEGRVFAGSPYTATLKAWRVVNGERRPLPVRVTRAAVSVTSGPSGGEAFEVTFHDDGVDGDAKAQDGVLTTRFVPSARSELSHATTARIDAYVEINGDPRHLVRDFVFAPRPVLEVHGIHDQLRDGSLVVTLDCEVFEDGVYTFYANLLAQDGSPIAMTKLSFPLKAGKRTAELTFFGKVIYDHDVDGPYIVRDIHGLKRAENDETDVWWNHPAAYTTRPYKAHELSDDEWNDPERTERLQNFERVIQQMDSQHAR
jgi:hypothetical protein